MKSRWLSGCRDFFVPTDLWRRPPRLTFISQIIHIMAAASVWPENNNKFSKSEPVSTQGKIRVNIHRVKCCVQSMQSTGLPLV